MMGGGSSRHLVPRLGRHSSTASGAQGSRIVSRRLARDVLVCLVICSFHHCQIPAHMSDYSGHLTSRLTLREARFMFSPSRGPFQRRAILWPSPRSAKWGCLRARSGDMEPPRGKGRVIGRVVVVVGVVVVGKSTKTSGVFPRGSFHPGSDFEGSGTQKRLVETESG